MMEQELNRNKMFVKMEREALKTLKRFSRKNFGVVETFFIISTMLSIFHAGVDDRPEIQELFDTHLEMWKTNFTKK